MSRCSGPTSSRHCDKKGWNSCPPHKPSTYPERCQNCLTQEFFFYSSLLLYLMSRGCLHTQVLPSCCMMHVTQVMQLASNRPMVRQVQGAASPWVNNQNTHNQISM